MQNMLKALVICCAVIFGGVMLTGCSSEEKHEQKSCADCQKAGAGKLCDACQKHMWAECSKKCEECKKLGDGHICAACQKHMREECDKAAKACEDCKKAGEGKKCDACQKASSK